VVVAGTGGTGLKERAPVISKPLMRGWLHAGATVAAIVGTIFLAVNTHGSATKLAACLVYGVSLVALLAFSATYHIPNWSPARRAFLRRIDHANIFVLIAGTYTPVVAVLMHGALRIAVLVAIWTIAIAGIAASTPVIRSRRRLLSGIYVGMGWIGVVMFPELLAAVGAAVLFIVAGGVLYSLGAIAYATQRPRLWPRIFGYHEVFHALVIAASASFYVFMIGVVAPYQTG
jgi:hemolysin III